MWRWNKTNPTWNDPAWCTEISQETAVNPVDIVSTLQSLQMLKYWKGKHLVLKRQVTVPVQFFFSSLSSFYAIVSLDHFIECKWLILQSAELTLSSLPLNFPETGNSSCDCCCLQRNVLETSPVTGHKRHLYASDTSTKCLEHLLDSYLCLSPFQRHRSTNKIIFCKEAKSY